MKIPQIIQGGMGIGISHSRLARICSMAGALGTVSCTGAERVFANLLGLGDLGGHYRRALAHFNFPEVADRVFKKYYVKGGKPRDKPFKQVPMWSLTPRPDLIELAVVASFCFVWLAREGHNKSVSINWLEKLQWHPYHFYGAMLAGSDKGDKYYFTLGAGIPDHVPEVTLALSRGETASYPVSVEKIGGSYRTVPITFNPREFFGPRAPKELERPGFLPIVSSYNLASILVKKCGEENIDGVVYETDIAGGHNANPRGKFVLDKRGQPVYGPKDKVDWDKAKKMGIPFWIGGGLASPAGLAEALSVGASGVQGGTIFALSSDSGMDPFYRAMMCEQGYTGELDVFTDPLASPTGFPFKVPQLKGTISEQSVYEARERECKISALQFAADMETTDKDGNKKIVTTFRCASEPVDDYVRKGGKLENTVGRVCLCPSLFGAAWDEFSEQNLTNPGQPPIFTLGDDVSFLPHLMRRFYVFPSKHGSYTATKAIKWILS